MEIQLIDGKRVEHLRLARGWTQGELAKEAGIQRGQVSQIESGKRQPYPRTATKIAGALGVEIADLMMTGDPDWGLQSSIARRAAVWDRSGGVCYYCGRELHPIRDFQVDHVVARANGGTEDMDNLVATCRQCNRDKRMVIDRPERQKQKRPAAKDEA